MTMTNWEIVRHYREAADRKADIRILAELNATDQETILRILEDAGEIAHKAPRKGKLKDEILRLYQQGLSDRKIADKLGCAVSTVGNQRRRMGLLSNRPTRRRRPGELAGGIGQLYEQGLTDSQIAGELGCSTSNVGRWRIRRGLPSNGRTNRKAADRKEDTHAQEEQSRQG